NFVMKHDFDGLTVRGQAGISAYGDAGQRLIAVTSGKNFGDGRGNIAIAFEHGEEDELNHSERRRLRGPYQVGFFENPNDPENHRGYTGPADNGIPDFVPL